MICEIRADKCYIPRTYISGFDLHKRLDVGTGLAQSVKQTRVPYGSSYSSWKEDLCVELLPQDDQQSHLESNRSVGMAALHCPEVAPTPPVEKYQDFGQNS